ncbi:hypothetical protein [Klenkia sp. PcliD-1-E]|uniref:hypothetical protein n=1 Tax=Klenkia sp. PcliD-1-E TaxID=2954492 RepID=UPI002097FAD7|nr:hypothetical protein [Klenkia sp. PcliD-1-E]MCO7220709.1 hypothetical protein [Klenkia sp. PcliD-1-E]
MIDGVAPGGDVWSAVAQVVVAVVLAVVFHRLRDEHVLAENAHLVFPPALAVGYVLAVAAGWALNVWVLVQAARGDLGPGTTAPANGVDVLLALTWFALAALVWVRLNRADAELHGPVAGLGRFLRVGIGTAVPSALRSLRRPAGG